MCSEKCPGSDNKPPLDCSEESDEFCAECQKLQRQKKHTYILRWLGLFLAALSIVLLLLGHGWWAAGSWCASAAIEILCNRRLGVNP